MLGTGDAVVVGSIAAVVITVIAFAVAVVKTFGKNDDDE